VTQRKNLHQLRKEPKNQRRSMIQKKNMLMILVMRIMLKKNQKRKVVEIKMKNQNTTLGTFIKSSGKIVETGKIDTPNTQIHDC
jgi:hypothetical protein